MRTRIFLKLLGAMTGMIALALVSVYFFTSPVVENNYIESRSRELYEKARAIEMSGVDALSDPVHVRALAKAIGARITLIDHSGKVLADSDASAATMENHATRPEMHEALQGRKGSIIRASGTLHRDFLYLAIPVKEGALRLAIPLSEVHRDVTAIRARTLESTLWAFIPILLIALYLAHIASVRFGGIIRYAGELANGNFHARLPVHRRGELAILAGKLNETSAKLERTVQQLQTEHAELEKLERIRKDFVINVSHELRTPLASIQGYTETLMDGAIHDQANNMRFLNIIRHNAERLARLTADLLALSRIEMKRQQFRFAPYRVNELLADILDTIRPIARKKDIALVQEHAAAGTEVFCDSEALYQILSNLVDNAVKYTPERGTITIGVRQAAPGGGAAMLEISVRDTGIGIPVEDQTRLFERFYRVDKARSRELGGTGLGLAIVKHLVRTHGGDVRVESRLNEGSTFFFTIPAEEAGAPAPELHPEFTAS